MTSDNQFNVSRRKVLAGLGTIGIASAGAGLGTTAFFSDEESVSASLEAGRLDLKLDYRATYNTWLPEAETDAIVNGNVLPDPDQEFNYIVGQAPDIRAEDGSAITGNEWAAFTRASDACEVDDEDSLAGEISRVGELLGEEYSYAVDGDDGYLGPEDQIYIDGEPGLKFDLNDVKPKDEGEATISIHTCGNPAFLWTRPFVSSASENGLVEPEESAGDTVDDGLGELANYIYVRIWDDVDCDNRLGEGPLDVMVVFDRSCSMEYANPFLGCDDGNTLVEGKLTAAKDGAKALGAALGDDSQIGLVSYNNNATLDQGLTMVGSGLGGYDSAVDAISAGGGTDIAAGIDTATTELVDNGRADARPIMVILSDGFPRDPNDYSGADEQELRVNSAEAAIDAAQAARDAGITVYTITYEVEGFALPEVRDLMSTGAVDLPPAGMGSSGPFGFDTPSGEGFATTTQTALVAQVDVNLNDGTLVDDTEIIAAFAEIAALAGERVLYQGSLAGFVEAAGDGLALRTARVGDDDDTQPELEPECFPPGVYCYAFDWYFVCEPEDFEKPSDAPSVAAMDEPTLADELAEAGLPLDVNVAQTDTVSFGLDFAAIQCRHNMDNANPFAPMDEEEEEQFVS
jgi:predicted ribosomally synthesized peptide with SipW-like signal peptide